MPLETLKSIADPCRLRLVAILGRGEFTVQELTGILSMGQSRVSRHLKILSDAGIVTAKRQGTWSYYRVGGENSFFSSLSPLLEQQLLSAEGYEKDLAAVARLLEERRRRSREFFDRNARQWDDLVKSLLPVPGYLPELLISVPVGGTLVEIGVGTGSLLPELVKRVDSLIGVDHSPAMLEEARQRLAEGGVGGVDLRLGEMTHLPLPDSSADCLLFNMVLHHAPDPSAVLHETARVLRPGGILLIADLARHERELVREQLADQWLGFEEDELAAWLEQAGFDGCSYKRIAGSDGQEAVLLVRGILQGSA